MRIETSPSSRIVVASDFHHPSKFSFMGFREISTANADVAILNGDIFDPLTPPPELVLKEWLSTIKKIAPRIIMIPGNHDKWLREITGVLSRFGINCEDNVIIDDILITHGEEIDSFEKEGIIKSRKRLLDLLPALETIREMKGHESWLIVGHTHLLEYIPHHKYVSCGTYQEQTQFFKEKGVIPGYGYLLITNGTIHLRRTTINDIMNYVTEISRETSWE